MTFSKKVHRAANAPFPECITVRVDSYFNDRVAARACGGKRLMHGRPPSPGASHLSSNEHGGLDG